MFNSKHSAVGLLAFVGGVATGLGMAVPRASATLLAYEPFNYTAGTNLVGTTSTGTGFTGTWTETGYNGGTETFTIGSGSLSYSGLPTAGNSVLGIVASSGTYPVNQESLATAIAAPTATNPTVTTWYSFLLKTPSTVNWNAGLQINGSTDTAVFGEAQNSANGTGTHWSISSPGHNTFGVETPAITIAANTTYFLVLEDTANYGSTDTMNLYVDPTVGLASPSVSAAVTDSLITVGKVSSIGLSTQRAYSFDEVRIGTTFADVAPSNSAIPEPASLGLLLLGSAGILLLGRRRGYGH